VLNVSGCTVMLGIRCRKVRREGAPPALCDLPERRSRQQDVMHTLQDSHLLRLRMCARYALGGMPDHQKEDELVTAAMSIYAPGGSRGAAGPEQVVEEVMKIIRDLARKAQRGVWC
jgi:hypothetical protein